MLPESTCRKARCLGFLIRFPSRIPKSTCSKHSVFDVFPYALGFVGFRQALERCAFAAPCGSQDFSDLSVRNKVWLMMSSKFGVVVWASASWSPEACRFPLRARVECGPHQMECTVFWQRFPHEVVRHCS